VLPHNSRCFLIHACFFCNICKHIAHVNIPDCLKGLLLLRISALILYTIFSLHLASFT
jgi:hypothetical protein